MSRSIDKTTRFILIALALIMAIGLAVNLSRKNALQEVQWDFKIFYFAAQAGRLGLDPYEIDNLRQVSGQQIELPFVYPPLTVWLFKPFTLLSYPVASQVWLFLKLALLSGLILLWRRHFIAGSLNGLFYLFLLFAFDAAIYWDFKAGNISLVEQLLLWMAFFLLLKRNGVGFGALVVLASTFKVITIVFLVLLPLSDIKHKWKYCLAGFAFFAVILGFQYVSDPGLFHNYLQHAFAVDERARDYNYAALAFFKDASGSFGEMTGIGLPSAVPVAAYLVAVAVILTITWRTFRQRLTTGFSVDPRLLVFLCCVIFALIAPRMKCYSYIIMIPPSFYILKEYVSAKAYPFIFLLLIMTVHNPLPQNELVRQYAYYYPLYMTFCVWILYLFYIRKASPAPERPV